MIKNKIKTLKELRGIVAALKKRKQRVVFTNGCFDILHLGHIKYLQKAKSLGQKLIVAVNSDASTRKLKGKSRPVFGQKARAAALASLECVDYVVVFSQETPLALIKDLKPDILVKGSDWKKEDIVGKEIVESCGGRVARIKFIKGYSTTSILNKIKNAP